MIKIGISSCLLGENVRYDGGHKRDHYLTDTLGKYVTWVRVCPEVEYGLPVPRESMRLIGEHSAPRLVTRRSGVDHTEGMQKWAQKKLNRLAGEDLSGFIFKSRSPSSGLRGVKVYTASGMPGRSGAGIFGKAFSKRFPLIPAEDDGRLHDPRLRDNFIERVFVFKRWQDLQKRRSGIRGLITFHTEHKLLLMSHSQKHYRLLGPLVAKARDYRRQELFSRYITLLMEGLTYLATIKKNTNVLMHIAGYFKKDLSGQEKQELADIIGNYHKGFIPLIVPVTLLNHYVNRFNEKYLASQHYLNPHPLELMLRNHV